MPCGPHGSEGGEQALLKTRLYSEMVTKSYIRFRDTDLVGEGGGQGWGRVVLTASRTCGRGAGTCGVVVGSWEQQGKQMLLGRGSPSPLAEP